MELTFPARREYLALARTVSAATARAVDGFGTARIEDVRLVVTEAVANAVDAASRRRQKAAVAGTPVATKAEITLTIRVHPDGVEVAVHDDEGGFDPAAAAAAPSATAPGRLHHERGLGIPLMRALADRVEFAPVGGGTTVTLWLRSPQGADRSRRIG